MLEKALKKEAEQTDPANFYKKITDPAARARIDDSVMDPFRRRNWPIPLYEERYGPGDIDDRDYQQIKDDSRKLRNEFLDYCEFPYGSHD